ncbi:MAG: prephenate dehydrogenase [Lactobacillales bacterium]|jgi:prephenate dehydrogenase|nr:prephenate dehydrogenase [Lactobacillales bacterium]
MKKVAIIGLGLIGGSIALGIKKSNSKAKLIGFDVLPKACEAALLRGVVTQVFPDLFSAVKNADVVFLAMPVKQTIVILKRLATFSLKKDVLITDVSSTKQEVLDCAEKLWQRGEVRFIGGHPMAGSHKSGVSFADENLFENAYYILTPSKKLADEQDITELNELLSGLSAKIQIMDVKEHDLIASQVSHLPHVLAAALVNQNNQYSKNHPFTKLLAAGGFRDMTRIASSDVHMWTEILLSNQSAISERIDDFVRHLKNVKQFILDGNETEIANFFENAREVREKMPTHQKGGLPNFYDLFVNVSDSPGAIYGITKILKKEKISLTNIRILETRTESYGILQLSFKNEKDLKKAKKVVDIN